MSVGFNGSHPNRGYIEKKIGDREYKGSAILSTQGGDIIPDGSGAFVMKGNQSAHIYKGEWQKGVLISGHLDVELKGCVLSGIQLMKMEKKIRRVIIPFADRRTFNGFVQIAKGGLFPESGMAMVSGWVVDGLNSEYIRDKQVEFPLWDEGGKPNFIDKK